MSSVEVVTLRNHDLVVELNNSRKSAVEPGMGKHYSIQAKGGPTREELGGDKICLLIRQALRFAHDYSKEFVAGKYQLELNGINFAHRENFHIHLVVMAAEVIVPPWYEKMSENIRDDVICSREPGNLHYVAQSPLDFIPDYERKYYLLQQMADTHLLESERSALLYEADKLGQQGSAEFADRLKGIVGQDIYSIAARDNYRVVMRGPYWREYNEQVRVICYHPAYKTKRSVESVTNSY